MLAVIGAVAGEHGTPLRSRIKRVSSLVPIGHLHPDILHFEWPSALCDYLPGLKLFKVPVVVSCRGRQVNIEPLTCRPRAESRLRTALNAADAVHCVSRAILDEASRYAPIAHKACVIPPAVETGFFVPGHCSMDPNRPFRVVSVGSLIWCKGYEYALIALRKLLDTNVSVTYEIVGDGPKSDRQRILYTAWDLQLGAALTLRGSEPPERVRDILQSADAFLHASVSEGMPNAALEAMACGLPVVTTDCGGVREAVTDGVEGFVVPLREPAAMADALLTLARNRSLAHSMGAAGRQKVLREFTLGKQAEAFLELYRSLVASKRTKHWHRQ